MQRKTLVIHGTFSLVIILWGSHVSCTWSVNMLPQWPAARLVNHLNDTTSLYQYIMTLRSLQTVLHYTEWNWVLRSNDLLQEVSAQRAFQNTTTLISLIKRSTGRRQQWLTESQTVPPGGSRNRKILLLFNKFSCSVKCSPPETVWTFHQACG